MVLKTVTFYFIYCLFIQGEVAEMQNLRRSSNPRLLSGFCWCHWNSVFPWMSEWWWICLDMSAEPSSSVYHAMPRCCLLSGVLLFQNDSNLFCLLLPTALLCNWYHFIYAASVDMIQCLFGDDSCMVYWVSVYLSAESNWHVVKRWLLFSLILHWNIQNNCIY